MDFGDVIEILVCQRAGEVVVKRYLGHAKSQHTNIALEKLAQNGCGATILHL
jgi:hypothetical protein